MKSNQTNKGSFWSANFGRLFLIFIPLLVGISLLFPTFNLKNIEETKTEMLKSAKDVDDSLAALDEFNKKYGDDYKSTKNNSLKLGLDLRGGMYVTLEIDVLKLIEESAFADAIDETFNEVLVKTRDDLKTAPDGEAIVLFVNNFNEIAHPKGKTLLNYFYLGNQKDISEEKIIEKLERNADDAIDQAKEVIRQRIDQYGVTEPNIQSQGSRRILLELPGIKDEASMRKLLQTTARLEFNLVRNNDSIVRAFAKIDKFLYNKALNKGRIQEILGAQIEDTTAEVTETEVIDSTKTEEIATTETDVTEEATTEEVDSNTVEPAEEELITDSYEGLSDEAKSKKYQQEHPFTSLFATYFVPGEEQQWQQVTYAQDDFPVGTYSFKIAKESLVKFRKYLGMPEIQSLIPADYRVLPEAKPDARTLKEQGIAIYELICILKKPELTGDVITDAATTIDQATGQPMVMMYMNSDGSDQWGIITGKNLHKRIAIILDDAIYSAPTVQSKITGGSSQITGMADMDEANRLQIVLKAGALKAPVKIIEERVVGPSLGEDSINSGLNASMFAFLLVILFMVVYYNKSGLVADFAVMVNVLLIIAMLAAMKGTLTLPGIAGIILTIGMAVDANVLIFERIREELARGRSVRSAVDEGYRKALSAIIDANITTGITATILLWLGSGPIKGFATTVLIGIIATLFTTLLVTRAFTEIALWRGKAASYNVGQPKLENKK